jgi:thiol:disulfide interchange protein DsbD
MMKKWLLLLSILIPFTVTVAAASPTPLMPDQAFVLTASSTTDKGINLRWKIAPGYHLYRDRIAVAVDKPTSRDVELGPIDLPPGTPEQDAIQGKYQEYQQQVQVNVPIAAPSHAPVTLLVNYQGCGDGSICYPPITKQIKFNLATNSPVRIAAHDPVEMAIQTTTTSSSFTSSVLAFISIHSMRVLLLFFMQYFVMWALRSTRRVGME